MFLEGLMLMHSERPDMFWQFMLAIAPVFGISAASGFRCAVQEARGRLPGFRRFLAELLCLTGLAVTWTWFLYPEWFSSDGVTLYKILGLWFLVMMFPVMVGLMVGICTFRVLFWLARKWCVVVE